MPSNRIGLEFISGLGLPPVAFARLADTLGCGFIGIALASGGDNPHGYPLWSLRDDKALRREFTAALADLGVGLSIGEGFLAFPGVPIENVAADLDIMAEMGVPIANIASIDPDPDRAASELRTFAGMAAERGMKATFEFLPGLPIADLPTAIAMARKVDHPALRILIDAMHVFRSGSTLADVADLDPDLVGYVQLCDVPLASGALTYVEEARYERLPLGEGELPLFDLLKLMPRDLVLGIEVPMRSRAAAGIGPQDRLAGSIATARDYLRRLDGE